MNDSENPESDHVLQKLLAECLEKLEQGEPIQRDRLRREHPEHAESIFEFLDNYDLVGNAIDRLRVANELPVVDSAFAPTLDSWGTSPAKQIEIGDSLQYIGEYRIVRVIARGGMGIVYEAYQESLRRTVALKMILAGRLASDSDVLRFQREARSAAKLRHPNIVSIHEVGQHEGYHYFTMDYIEGESLAARLRVGSLAPRTAARMLKIVAEAVHYAHQHGVLHRDLKPANILLNHDGQPHITDFGLAKLFDSEDVAADCETKSGQIVGTPSYMSPEQARGQRQLIGVASDVHSLGATLYACLCGRPPFIANSTVETLRQVADIVPIPVRVLNNQVEWELGAITEKCLEKRIADRYGSAWQLSEDLGRFIDGRAVHAKPMTVWRSMWRWYSRNARFIVPLVALLMHFILIAWWICFVIATLIVSPSAFLGTGAVFLGMAAFSAAGMWFTSAAFREKRFGYWGNTFLFVVFAIGSMPSSLGDLFALPSDPLRDYQATRIAGSGRAAVLFFPMVLLMSVLVQLHGMILFGWRDGNEKRT